MRCRGFGEERGRDGDTEDHDDDTERQHRADLDPVAGEHFDGGEGEDGGEAVMEKAQLCEEVDQQEIKRAKAHDCHDVRCIREEWVAGDGEDGGNGVEGEDNVGELDGDQREEEDGSPPVLVFDDEEVVLVETDGVYFRKPADPDRGFLTMRGGHDETDGSDEEDSGEDIADPGEAVEEADAGDDEGSAHDDSAEDSPEEDAGLLERLDLEDAEEEQEDEEIVDRERLFDGISGEVLDGKVASNGVKDEEREGQGGSNPEDGGDDGGPVSFGWGWGSAAAGVEELNREQHEQEDVEANPMAERGRAGHLLWMLSRERPEMHVARLACAHNDGINAIKDKREAYPEERVKKEPAKNGEDRMESEEFGRGGAMWGRVFVG